MPLLNVLEATSADQRARLARAGYVRVDGLGAYKMGTEQVLEYVIKGGERISAGSLGKSDYNNGQHAICTLGGEIWLRKGSGSKNHELDALILELIKELAPRGYGLFVPCSNGEHLACEQVRMRLANVDWMPTDSDNQYGDASYRD